MALLLTLPLLLLGTTVTGEQQEVPSRSFGSQCASTELAAPPRGWNSYDSSPPWTGPDGSTEASTEEATLRDAARLASELLPHGYDTLTLDSGWFGEDNLYGTQTIDHFGRLSPNLTQFPSAVGDRGFVPLSGKIHAHGLKFGIWIMGGVPRMAVEANSPIKGTNWTAADIAIVDGAVDRDGKPVGSLDCPWNKWLMHGINMSHPGSVGFRRREGGHISGRAKQLEGPKG